MSMKAYKYSDDEKGTFEEIDVPPDLKDELNAKLGGVDRKNLSEK